MAPKNINPWVNNIYAIYLALVCAFSLLVSVVLIGSVLTSALDLVFPREPFIEARIYDGPKGEARELSTQEITERRGVEERSQRNNELRSLIHSLVYLLISSAVYLGHRRLFRRRLQIGA